MPYDLSRRFVVAISSRALFDANRENGIYESEGQDAYDSYQRKNADKAMSPGAAFGLVRALLKLNEYLPDDRNIEVVLVSRNSVAAGKRIANSIKHHELLITRSGFTTGGAVAKYLKAFHVDLFLSANGDDVQAAYESGHAAALMYGLPKRSGMKEVDCIRIAFDGDSVLFSDDSERIYQEQGMDAFHEHESGQSLVPLEDGPFRKVLVSLAYIQRRLPKGKELLKTAIVTARNAPSDVRVLNTLEEWGVKVDELFFMGGVRKDELLEVYDPHIFFDDHPTHCAAASVFVPTGQVPSNLFTVAGALKPPCPRCGGEMEVRLARQGPTAGKRFFGCKSFPACRGSVSMA